METAPGPAPPRPLPHRVLRLLRTPGGVRGAVAFRRLLALCLGEHARRVVGVQVDI